MGRFFLLTSFLVTQLVKITTSREDKSAIKPLHNEKRYSAKIARNFSVGSYS